MSSSQGSNSQVSWSRWMLAVLVGVPTVGYLYYRFCHKPSPTSGSDQNGVAKKGGDVRSTVKKEKQDPQTPLDICLSLKVSGNEFFKGKKFQDAIRCYSEAIEICPKEEKEHLSTLYQNRAAAYECLNNLGEVITNCTEAIKLNPSYLKALLRRYKSCEKLGQLRMALEDVTACCILQQFNSNDELTNADRILKCLGLEEAKKYSKTKPFTIPSKHFMKQYLMSFPDDPVTNFIAQAKLLSPEETSKGIGAAKKAMKDERFEDILKYCDEEINLVKETSAEPSLGYYEALLLRGTLYLITFNEVLANSDFDTVIDSCSTIHPQLAISAYLKKAGHHMQEGELDKAAVCFEKAIEIDPNNADIYHQRAQMLLLHDKLAEAYDEFQKAENLSPKSVLITIQRIFSEYKLAQISGDATGAKAKQESLKEVVFKNPTVTEGFLLLAQMFNENQEFSHAMDVINKALEHNPENATLLVHRGLIHLQWKGDMDEAVKDMEKAIEVDPKSEYAYETLATVEVQRANLLKAISLFDKALPLTKCVREAAHIFSLKAAAQAQHSISATLGLQYRL